MVSFVKEILIHSLSRSLFQEVCTNSGTWLTVFLALIFSDEEQTSFLIRKVDIFFKANRDILKLACAEGRYLRNGESKTTGNGLEQRFSQCGPWTSNISITWEHNRKVHSPQASPKTYGTQHWGGRVQQSVINKSSRWFWYTSKFESHWFRWYVNLMIEYWGGGVLRNLENDNDLEIVQMHLTLIRFLLIDQTQISMKAVPLPWKVKLSTSVSKSFST